MIKDYINVRVFVLLDLGLAATWILLSIGGWSVIKQYPQVDAIIWGIISIPLALIGVAMIYQRANLVHRKHVNIQHIYEQEQEIRLIHLRQQQSLPSPKQNYYIEENEDVKQVYHGQGTSETPYRNVPLFQGVSDETEEKVSAKDNCNVATAYFLADNPGASIRDVAKEIGYPIATINRTNAWKNRSR